MPDIVWLANGLRDSDTRGVQRDQAPASDTAIPGLNAWLGQPAHQRAPHVWLSPDANVAALAPYVKELRLIALEFPKPGDGRAYSQASLLRLRYGFQGELRAVGDVAIDQLGFLRRLGFDSVELAPRHQNDTTLATIRRVLARFSDAYQSSVDEPLPSYRRHARPSGGATAQRDAAHT